MIHFVCWKWRSDHYRTKFTAQHVNVLQSMLARHCSLPHRLVCVTDDETDVEVECHPLWSDMAQLMNPSGFNLPSCYRRLKLFDPDTTRAMGVADGEPVVSIDLDVVLTGKVDHLFALDGAQFLGWQGQGSYQPHVYNGSLWMFPAAGLPWMWSEFDPERSPLATREARFFGSDQGWLSLRLAGPDGRGWDVPQGVYSYARDLVSAPALPDRACVVFFNGKRKPWESSTQCASPWIRKHWR